MPITDPNEYLNAADELLADVEKSKLVSKEELEVVRQELSRQMRDEVARGTQGLATISVGGLRILAPTSQNIRDIKLISERSRQRFTNFRLAYLSSDQVEELRKGEGVLDEDPKKFIRHSRRLAKHTRRFLSRIKELEPSLEAEVNQTLLELEDNDMDLLKLEVKSFTRMRETLLRSVQGRKERGAILQEIEAFDINRSQWNLSLLEHPRATVQGLLGNAVDIVRARKGEETVTEAEKRAHVLIAPTPDAQTKMTKGSRTASMAWRLFNTEKLNRRFEAISASRQTSGTSWRGLGLDFNTAEWYLPVGPEILDSLSPLVAARRAAMLRAIEASGAL